MFIGWQTYWILFTNNTKCPAHYQVCEHLQVGLCKSQFIQVENVVVTNSQSLSFLCSILYSCFCFDFLTMWWRQIKELHRRLLPPYHSSCFLQILNCMLDLVCCMLFVYVRPWRRKAVHFEIFNLVKEIYIPDCKVPFKYGYSFSRLKWMHYICPFKVGV